MPPIIRRPMQNRQIAGAMFGEDATLIRVSTTYDRRGRASTSETRSSIRVATNPLTLNDPRAAILMEGGTRLEDLRVFYTNEDVDPSARDAIEFGGEKYTIVITARYGDHSESIGSRKEVQ